MKKIIIFTLVFTCTIGFAQNKKEKVSRRIQLVEKYTSPDFKMPKKILWYTGGNFSLEDNYRSLFKKLDKRLNKSDNNNVFRYKRNASLPKSITSFDELDLKFNNSDFNAICVVLAGDYEMSQPTTKNGNVVLYDNRMPEYFYDFYLILVESNTNRILMKRKYSVRDTDMFKKDNKELVKVISKAFKR
ncbi:MAG: hypothetical protein ED556_00250 [Winogradskyella sp.]|uniref:hypothetical protein n=1 Tax=Winogradskyella sp. TaxID=1883156 RepID=UPI000F3C8F18|nr:hypothetical protein [Winogradskyella sp.]RNC87655.1 MAG: hypothetical protein ED556_00250 [Winogradskyella sp.]